MTEIKLIHSSVYFICHISEYEVIIVGENPFGIVANMLDCNIVINKSENQLYYYIHFKTITFGKGMKPLFPSSYGLNSTTTVFLLRWLWH